MQINGVVYAQVMVGNTVYATGGFTAARPAGAAPGVNEVTRSNLLAYDVTTGDLLPFNHSLDGAGRAITVSPDGSRIYVGGSFTHVDGKVHNRVAAFRTSDGALLGGFTGSVDSTVRALAATNTAVYLGGTFSKAKGGLARGHLAAFDTAGNLLDWKPAADRAVLSMVMSPDRSKVVFGGGFSQVNGIVYHGLAAADASSGTPLAWASQSNSYPIRDDGTSSGINSLSANSNTIFLTGFNYQSISKPGGFEGRAAISPSDGSVIWLNDCHGDTYSAYPIGNVLYSVGHAHDCQPAGYFPDTNPRVWHRALAEGITATHRNGLPTGGYTSFYNWPASDQYVWYPSVNTGTYTGQNQGGWSITGNSNYVSMGGQFTKVNNKGQQGLARFAISSIAPDKIGPQSYAAGVMTATTADQSGRVQVRWPATWDKDNERLTYQLYRAGTTNPIYTTTVNSKFWILPTLSFQDSGVTPGTQPAYTVVVTDPFGNKTTTSTS